MRNIRAHGDPFGSGPTGGLIELYIRYPQYSSEAAMPSSGMMREDETTAAVRPRRSTRLRENGSSLRPLLSP